MRKVRETVGADLLFLKLGGSLITDKMATEAVRADTLNRLALEIAAARQEQPELQLVIGHGSGSFGHAAAAAYQTHKGVQTPEAWAGFCKVNDAAARLNRQVCAALLAANVPAVSVQPSASVVCRDGRLSSMATMPIRAALEAGIVPLVYGDAVFDEVRGGSIVSTEQVLSYLAQEFRPDSLLLAGNTAGVYDLRGEIVSHISRENIASLDQALGGSAGADVTGGMRTKVHDMLALAEEIPGLSIRILSGMDHGRLYASLVAPHQPAGTLITA